MTRKLNINIEVTRNYGSHSVKFGIGEEVQISNGQARRDAYANLFAQLDDQIKLYEDTILQETRLPMVTNTGAASTSYLKQIPAVELVVENKQGKRMLSLKGGEYSQFGVPVYTDTCTTDLELDLYEYGVHDLSRHSLTATIDVVEGKAKRVLSIK